MFEPAVIVIDVPGVVLVVDGVSVMASVVLLVTLKLAVPELAPVAEIVTEHVVPFVAPDAVNVVEAPGASDAMDCTLGVQFVPATVMLLIVLVFDVGALAVNVTFVPGAAVEADAARDNPGVVACGVVPQVI